MATASTAVFAGLGGVAACAYRRDVMRDAPIVEANLSWTGDFILARVCVTNPLPITLGISKARVKQPAKCKIASDFEYDQYGRHDLTLPKPATPTSANIDYPLPSAGSTMSGPPGMGMLAADEVRID